MSTYFRTARPALVAATALALSLGATALHAQAPAAPPAANALKVGDAAPDFTLVTVTKNGLEAKPFKLSEHRGETIVLAFFPKARTSGCTTQMKAYRDQYAQVFQDGKKVTLIGVSTDPDSALTSWAKDEQFPFRFGADTDKAVGNAYGASRANGGHNRHLYVIDPKGKIAYIATPFLQMSADAYTALGTAVTTAGASK